MDGLILVIGFVAAIFTILSVHCAIVSWIMDGILNECFPSQAKEIEKGAERVACLLEFERNLNVALEQYKARGIR